MALGQHPGIHGSGWPASHDDDGGTDDNRAPHDHHSGPYDDRAAYHDAPVDDHHDGATVPAQLRR